jgi:O-6-methylguanine DNA methyltransferase
LTLHCTFIETPVGTMRAMASGTALCACEFYNDRRMARLDARLVRWFGAPDIHDGANRVLEQTSLWLDAYFSGLSADAATLPLDLRGAPFELKVWHALRGIAPGTTATYGGIAARVHSPGAARAVGLANGANPIAIIVPCHRVIGSDGTLTGYGGGLDKKTWLLDHEKRWRTTPGNLRLEF